MTSDPPDLGKGIFGYRKSAVNQILADRDIMLRQAEGRVRAAESKVADLQNEIGSMKDRNTRMDEQIERLRSQLDALMAAAKAAQATPAPSTSSSAPAAPPISEATPATQAAQVAEPTTPAREQDTQWDSEPGAWEDDYGHPADPGDSPFREDAVGAPYDEYGESVASFEGLDQAPSAPDADAHADMPLVFGGPEEQHGEASDTVHLFSDQDHESGSVSDFAYDTTTPEGDRDFSTWVDAPPPSPEPMRKVDEMMYQPDDHAQNPPPAPSDDDDFSSVSYGFSLHPAQPEGSEGHDDFGAHPAFRGFSDDAFDEPSPGEYLGQPTTESAAPHATTPAPEWAIDQGQEWASEPPRGADDWTAPQAAAQASPGDWQGPRAQPAQDSAPPPTIQPAAPPSASPAQSPASDQREGISPQASDITNRFLTEELTGILAAAEESAARILERARVTSEHQIAQSNRLWREVQAELARFSGWREQVEPIIRSVHAKVEGVRSQIEEVPEKIRQALAPMADSISMIDSDLAELASASTPPLLLTPSGLDPGSAVNDWSIGEAGTSPEASEDHAKRGGQDSGHLAG